MVTFLGIEFAPLFVPWRRRMQTIAVAHYVGLFAGPYFVLIFTLMALIVWRLWWLMALYGLWLYIDRDAPKRGSRPLNLIRRWSLYRHMRDYFPIRLVKTAELDPNRNYLIGYHPHGVMSFGAFCVFSTEASDFSKVFPGIKPYLCTLVGNFWFPIRREYMMSFNLIDVSRESISWLLGREEKGYAAVVVVGGAREALEAYPGTHTLILNKRKGFIKTAIQTGADLVPCYAFGENDVYNRFDNQEQYFLYCLQLILKKLLGWVLPVIRGRGLFNYSYGVLPHRRPIYCVLGRPIYVKQSDEPDQDQIDNLHKQYVEQIKELFDKYKNQYASTEDCQLVIL
ncbi:diacylglycerol acyltransferase [Trichuris suis]|nr:diacylglycerol acyltransferase [Trichuris suis]